MQLSKTLSPVDRKAASKLLRVSVRTIDRYIRSGKLAAYRRNGRILLDRKALQALTRTHMDREDIVPVTITSSAVSPMKHDQQFYKDLYEEAKRALQDYQQKLEQSTYRIGQLESHIVSAQPQKLSERRDDSPSFEILKRDLYDRDKELFVLREALKKERASRIIFAVLTYLLLLLQPIFWYFLS